MDPKHLKLAVNPQCAPQLIGKTHLPDGDRDPELIRRLLIGSVTQRLVRDAACDVLIRRPRKHEA